MNTSKVIQQDKRWQKIIWLGGVAMIAITLAMGAFLFYRGLGTFYLYGHTPFEFLFAPEWAPADTDQGGGKVGAAIYIFGSISTCLLALVMATPLSVGLAVFMTEISPAWGRNLLQPVVEIFVGIPSIVYGWLGLTVLVPFIRTYLHATTGFSVLAAAVVLGVMIFPTITSVTVNALQSVPRLYRQGAYGLGATRWEVIWQIVLPVAKQGILSGLILGLARAFGEALAVAMVIGKMKAFPTSLLAPTVNLTGAIASDMGGSMEGGEYNMALWTMALLLFLISLGFIFLMHYISGKGESVHG